MRISFLSIFAISSTIFSQVFAESYPTTWLVDHSLTIESGDDIEIYAVPELNHLDLSQINWESGTLRLTGCILDSNFNSTRIAELPLIVDDGQILYLNDVVIQNADVAVHVLDGEIHLENVTLSTDLKGVLTTDPLAVVEMLDVRVTVAEIGFDLQSAAQVHIDNCVFLSNDLAINQAFPASVTISNTIFQANEQGLVLHSNATVPSFGPNVDFVDSKYWLISNLSSNSINLDTVFLSDHNAVNGPWVGTPVIAPHAPLYSEAPPIIIGAEVVGDDVPLECIPAGFTTDGIPCRTTVFDLLFSTTPYGDFESIGRYSVGEQVLISRGEASCGFYQARTCLGEWLD
jgi:hypothetical protein